MKDLLKFIISLLIILAVISITVATKVVEPIAVLLLVLFAIVLVSIAMYIVYALYSAPVININRTRINEFFMNLYGVDVSNVNIKFVRYKKSILGFYCKNVNNMIFINSKDSRSLLDVEMTVVHEINHYCQHQHGKSVLIKNSAALEMAILNDATLPYEDRIIELDSQYVEHMYYINNFSL